MCNDTVMTNKWHSVTGVTNLCPPLHIWPLPLSQTTLVKQDGGAGKTGKITRVPLSEKCLFTFWPTDDNSRLFSALAQIHGRMPTFFHLWPYFHLSQFFPSQFGGKEKLILVTYSEPCTPGTSIFSCDFQKGRRNRSFWHIPWCTPRDIALSAIVNVHFNFGSVDIQSFCLGDSAQIPASLILLFAYSNVTFLCYSNFQFVIFKYLKLNLIIGDFSEADIGFSHLPFTFEQIFQEKTFWMDSLINFLTKEIFRNSKYFPAPSENVSKCVFLMNGQT